MTPAERQTNERIADHIKTATGSDVDIETVHSVLEAVLALEIMDFTDEHLAEILA